MAKKTKAPKNGASEKTANAADNMLFPPSTLVRKLADDGEKAVKRSREITGAFGQQVSEASDKKHVDKFALSKARAFKALSDERLAISLPHFLRYIDDMGLAERANRQANLFEENAQAGEGEEGEGEAGEDGGKVTRIGRAARRVMEQAGANPPGD